MADPGHLEILKQGVEVWNKWREENPDVTPVLSCASFHEPNFQGINFSDAKLNYCELVNSDLTGANLNGARFIYANLSRATLTGASLVKAQLTNTILRNADLRRADLSGAKLERTNFQNADLTQATLDEADLSWANLQVAVLHEASLKKARINLTNLARATLHNADVSLSRFHGVILTQNDLRFVKGLDTVLHFGPSSIGTDTLRRSEGRVPERFLRGCGLPDWEIAGVKLHQSDLTDEEINNFLYQMHDLRAHQAVQISPLFISYSHADSSFVDEVEVCMNEKGIRFWRDVHHATAGRLETQIDRAIRLNPTVLLVLSEHSVRSDWVEHEARLARKLEQETGRDVLCPVALDDSWKTCRWPERLREQIMEYNVLDFSNWQDPDYMRRMFSRLKEGLGLFYK